MQKRNCSYTNDAILSQIFNYSLLLHILTATDNERYGRKSEKPWKNHIFYNQKYVENFNKLQER